MSSGVFKLISEIISRNADELNVSPPHEVSIIVKHVSGMPACGGFIEFYEQVQEIMKLYADLLARDSEELKQFIKDSQTTDEAN